MQSANGDCDCDELIEILVIAVQSVKEAESRRA
jgi:hypothetical protein